MMFIRPVKLQDLDAVELCASAAGPGIINLPKKRELLKEHIQDSVASLSKEVSSPHQEDYFFVLADSHNIGGTCGIYSQIGKKHPFYVFQREQSLLRFQEYQKEASEVCALYLKPPLRKEGYGKLLSLSRFLFMAAQPQRFCKNVIANMRGYAEDNRSPFWNGVGRQYLPMEFEEVMALRSQSDDFIKDIFPKDPIDISLLTEEARKAIGIAHPHTQPAIKMLMQQGFVETLDIDPIDGGPILSAILKEIRTIKHSNIAKVIDVSTKPIQSEPYIISNDKLDFRACYTTLQVNDNKEVIIPSEVAEALEVSTGDIIRYIAVS